jgi:hypothetical protein
MEGVSSHFDHVTGRHVMGHQVLTLGLATEEAFLPLDSQIYISQVKARELITPYKDGRSIAGKRYSEAAFAFALHGRQRVIVLDSTVMNGALFLEGI